jgi:hypothetical protein
MKNTSLPSSHLGKGVAMTTATHAQSTLSTQSFPSPSSTSVHYPSLSVSLRLSLPSCISFYSVPPPTSGPRLLFFPLVLPVHQPIRTASCSHQQARHRCNHFFICHDYYIVLVLKVGIFDLHAGEKCSSANQKSRWQQTFVSKLSHSGIFLLLFSVSPSLWPFSSRLILYPETDCVRSICQSILTAFSCK